MDRHFIAQPAFGAMFVKSSAPDYNKPLDVHLISEPIDYPEQLYAWAEYDYIQCGVLES
jgi:pentose-5-phosphate-3-epimerase